MKKELIEEIESLSASNIDYFIQFWGDQTNIKMADIDPLQADILFYLNSLKHFWLKADGMQKALEWYADEENYKRSENDVQTGYPHEIMWDKGIKARQVLKHLGLTVEGIEE